MRDDLPRADETKVELRRGLGIRHKIVFLVLLSALLPAFIVGTVSYIVARGFLTEKVEGQLLARLAAAREEVEGAIGERVTDTEVFAHAFVVTRGLESRAGPTTEPTDRFSALEDQQRYLDEVGERYPLYSELQVLDRDGMVVARSPASATGLTVDGSEGAVAPAPSVRIERLGSVVVVEVRRPVTSTTEEGLGTLVTVSRLDDLWRELHQRATDSDRRLLLTRSDGLRLFDSSGRAGEAASGQAPAVVDRSGSDAGGAGVFEHFDAQGRRFLTAFDRLPQHDLELALEADAKEAFAAVSGLRAVMLLISGGAALLVTALGALLAGNLTRPIDALIAGARVAAKGDLSSRIPVSSSDEIGELTVTFNSMIRSLRRSQERLELLSVTDELTGLYNRRYLTRAIEKELKLAKRSGRPFAVIMIDLDRFKAFNDERGHYEGDTFLQLAAGILESEFRPSDVVARYGGEEFVVLLPDAGKAQAGAIAERVRLRFAVRAQAAVDAPQVTISAGVAAHPEDGMTRTELMVNADMALYQAKRLGRNRVELCRAA